ncbi:MAG: GNAT family N-acetyltransferase, partial [Candidatus Bipolaricaulia bacterium]
MIIRRATPEDKDDILKISARVWEGHDYIPLALDRWLKEGGLLAAELDGRVVGFAKTSVLGPGELWLEGLRVHPEYRGKGIAKALAATQLQEALAQSPRSVRFATAEVNVESIHISEELGFREIARFTYMAGPIGEGIESPKVAPADDPAEIAEFIFNSEAYHESRGLLPQGWIFKEFSETLLEELIRQGALFYYAGEGEVRGALVLLPAHYGPGRLVIASIEGDGEALAELMGFAHRYAREQGYVEFHAMVPTEQLVRVLAQHGLSFTPDFR